MIIYQLTTNLAERLSVIYFAYCLKIICKNMLLVVHEFRNIFFFTFLFPVQIEKIFTLHSRKLCKIFHDVDDDDDDDDDDELFFCNG